MCPIPCKGPPGTPRRPAAGLACGGRRACAGVRVRGRVQACVCPSVPNLEPRNGARDSTPLQGVLADGRRDRAGYTKVHLPSPYRLLSGVQLLSPYTLLLGVSEYSPLGAEDKRPWLARVRKPPARRRHCPREAPKQARDQDLLRQRTLPAPTLNSSPCARPAAPTRSSASPGTLQRRL